MYVFFLLLLLIYGGMHFHMYRKVSGAFVVPFPFKAGMLLFMGLMVFAPILVRFAERKGSEWIALPLAYAGYLWMGFIFLFFTTSLLVDLGRVLLRCPLFTSHGFHPSDRQTLMFSLFVSLGLTVYGFHEALDIRTEKVVINTEKLPGSMERLRIVQVSDVHLGLIVREKRLRKIVRTIQEARPDVLVSTGDLVDGQIDGMETFAAELGKLRPLFGKYAVMGNHEYYAGIGTSLDFTRQAGFDVLRGESRNVGDGLTIVGVDDPASKNEGLQNPEEKDILASIPRERFVLLLKHRPTVEKGSAGLFDLQLSGHVHKGQIFPFTLFTRLAYPVVTGLSFHGGSALYVSRGTGTWGPPIRFLAPPEVTVIELVRKVE